MCALNMGCMHEVVPPPLHPALARFVLCTTQVPWPLFLRLAPEMFLFRDPFRMLRFGEFGAPYIVPPDAMGGVFLNLPLRSPPRRRVAADNHATHQHGQDKLSSSRNLSHPRGAASSADTIDADSVCTSSRWATTCHHLRAALVNSTLDRRGQSMRACVLRERRRLERSARRSGRQMGRQARHPLGHELSTIGGDNASAIATEACGRSKPTTSRVLLWAQQAAKAITHHAHLVYRTVDHAGCAALTQSALRRLGSLSHVFFTDASKLSLDHAQHMAQLTGGGSGADGDARASRGIVGSLQYVNRAMRVQIGLFDERGVAPFHSCSQHVYGTAFASLSAAASRFEALAEMDVPVSRIDAQLDSISATGALGA